MRLQKPETDRIAPCWAVPAGGATPVPASTDADLMAQFDARVRHLFVALDIVLAEGGPTPVAIDTLRDALHKVAGTAAFFGKADLGRAAADLDDQLGEPDTATPAFLQGARAALQRACGSV